MIQRKEDDVSGSKALVEEIRSDVRQKIQENSEKLKEIEELLGILYKIDTKYITKQGLDRN